MAASPNCATVEKGTDLTGKRTLEENRKAPLKAVRNAATVLVVDDDQTVLELLSDYLEEKDYNIETAKSGEEALGRMSRKEIDIALVDIKLPGMDGLETIEKLAEIDHDLVTILMTGFPTIDSSVKAIRLGASDYILKPFRLDEVRRSVAMAIKERETRREMKNLKVRVCELEKGISDKKDSIRVNRKLGGG
jgi:DNA-binding NtrC family response regulator